MVGDTITLLEAATAYGNSRVQTFSPENSARDAISGPGAKIQI